MAGIAITNLPQATVPLTGSELTIVEQGGVTKKSTINAGQQIALDAANAAQSTADSALSDATTALDTANTALANANAAQIDADAAQTAANNAQSTADSKLSTVAVDGTTITGNGTVGNELVANIPTIYQEITKADFADLVLADALVAGASYLVTDAYFSVVYDRDFPILVTAISTTDISNLSWAKYVNPSPSDSAFVKCRTNATFSFIRFYETCGRLFLTQAACQRLMIGTGEFDFGCIVTVLIGGALWKTTIDDNGFIVVKNVLNISYGTPAYGSLGEIDIDADTYILYESIPTSYQEITKSAFLALRSASKLIAGRSYLVTGAYSSTLFSASLDILVTAKSSNDITGLNWTKFSAFGLPFYLKSLTNSTFSFSVLLEHCVQLALTPAMCLAINEEIAAGVTIYILGDSGASTLQTQITGDASGQINYTNVKRLSPSASFGSYNPTTDVFTPNPVAPTPPKEYRAYLTISGSTITPKIFQNDVGNIVWTKPSNGVLNGNLAGAFPDNKCWIIAGLFQGGNIYYPSAVVYPADPFNPNAFIQIDIVKNDGSQTSTPNGTFAIHLIINN